MSDTKSPLTTALNQRLPKLKWWQWALIGVAVLVVLSAIIGGVNGERDATPAAPSAPAVAASPATEEKPAADEPTEEPVEMVDVPDLVGSTVAEARTALDAIGVTLTTTDAGDDWVVVTQTPARGSHPLEGLELSITAEAPKPVYTLEQQNALDQAQSYLEFMPFSRQGLIDQLSSEYGSGYPVDVATWAADTVGADWNAEAAEAAQSYLDTMSFSRQGLYDQLTSPYGGQFTPEQANHGLAAVGY